jgi:plastocyanin
VFKSWQVFVFSLVPLALVLTGVIVGSIHFSGGDAQKEIFPTPAPQAANNTPPPAAPAGTTALNLVAQNIQFTTRTLTATAGQPVQLTFDNRDAGVLHDVSFSTNPSATTSIYKTDLLTGPAVKTFNFTAPTAPGNYYFRCDVHPDTMTGSFVVR